MFCIVFSFRGFPQNGKATYVYNFTKFIEWSPAAFSPKNDKFIILVYGEGDLGKELKAKLTGEKIKSLSWEIIFYNKKDFDEKKLSQCHLLIFENLESTESINMLKIATSQKHLLTIGNNIKDFCKKGGIINLTEKDSGYSFEINNKKALSLEIIISSQLLNLAKIINTN